MKTTHSHGIRVLFVLPTLQGGGAERVVTLLLRSLDRSRFEPHLALLARVGPYLKELPEDVTLHDLKSPRVRHAILPLVRLLRRLAPDVTVSSLYELNLAVVAARALACSGSAVVLREDISLSARLAGARFPGLWRELCRRLYARADRIVGVSDSVVNDLAERFRIPRAKMVRIYNPIDLNAVRQMAETGGDPYSGAGPHVVAVGRLHQQKGFDVLLSAMTLVRASTPTAELTVLGGGPLEAELKVQRDRLGLADSVHFVGFQANPYRFMKHSDVLVLPSRYEGGASLVVMEALALGKPVVVADCPGGVRELLEGCPLAHLVPAGDSPALAGAITETLKSGLESHRVEGVEALLDRFRVERVVREYEKILCGPGMQMRQ